MFSHPYLDQTPNDSPTPFTPNPQSAIRNRRISHHPKTILHQPPAQNSDNFAPPPHSNRQPANNLRGRGAAKFAEFRSTRKNKEY
jgi:hypothetical protein